MVCEASLLKPIFETKFFDEITVRPLFFHKANIHWWSQLGLELLYVLSKNSTYTGWNFHLSLGSLENDNGDLYLTQNGARYLVGQLTPVVFQENSSLNPEGDNLYSATIESGDPLYISEKAEVLNSFLEVSSSDLSDALVNLMIWQRAFEANSKSVSTSDELLQTALDLKRS